MHEVTEDSFGLLVAFLIPGVIVLAGFGATVSPSILDWMGASPQQAPTIGGFLYTTVVALTVGIVVSTIRWALLDTLHHKTGIPRPAWDFRQLQDRVEAFVVIQRNHYRFYQFYGNTLVASLLVYGLLLVERHDWLVQRVWIFALGGPLIVLLYLGSRDTLRKYYSRTTHVLQAGPERH